LGTAVIPHTALLAYVGCRAFSLLHSRLLYEGLRLAVQLFATGVEGAGMAQSSVTAAMSFWLTRGGVFGSSTLKSH
jgi:hypothetical protein